MYIYIFGNIINIIFFFVKNFSEKTFTSITNLHYQSLESLDETDHDLNGAGGVEPHSQAHLDVEGRGDVHHGLGGAHQHWAQSLIGLKTPARHYSRYLNKSIKL